MKITAIKADAVRIARDPDSATGTAGSPARLWNAGGTGSEYRLAESYPTVYSTDFRTTVVRVETDDGLVGWGEAQSPVAPEVSATIINCLLAPILIGQTVAPEVLWFRMYSAMRVRGHFGGFLLDAITGVDIALWDLLGKSAGRPICSLLGGPFAGPLPSYISGLAGNDESEKLAYATDQARQGARCFKLFLDGSQTECLSLIDHIQERCQVSVAVDALWRLSEKSARQFAGELGKRKVRWLEAPLAPEDVEGHGRLAAATTVPIALGESYRTRFELLPFFQARALDLVQPDTGRTGITEGRKIASLADSFHIPVAPHLSIGLGPQIAAALHLAAAIPNLEIVECNPKVFEIANRFLRTPLCFSPSAITVPDGPGLGISIDEQALKDLIQ
jgi:galactonate dehydratase